MSPNPEKNNEVPATHEDYETLRSELKQAEIDSQPMSDEFLNWMKNEEAYKDAHARLMEMAKNGKGIEEDKDSYSQLALVLDTALAGYESTAEAPTPAVEKEVAAPTLKEVSDEWDAATRSNLEDLQESNPDLEKGLETMYMDAIDSEDPKTIIAAAEAIQTEWNKLNGVKVDTSSSVPTPKPRVEVAPAAPTLKEVSDEWDATVRQDLEELKANENVDPDVVTQLETMYIDAIDSEDPKTIIAAAEAIQTEWNKLNGVKVDTSSSVPTPKPRVEVAPAAPTLKEVSDEWDATVRQDLEELKANENVDPDVVTQLETMYIDAIDSEDPKTIIAAAEAVDHEWRLAFPELAPKVEAPKPSAKVGPKKTPPSAGKSTPESGVDTVDPTAEVPQKPAARREAPAQAPEAAQKTFRDRLGANKDKKPEDRDETKPYADITSEGGRRSVTLHLPTAEDVRNSRVTDVVGKEGALLVLSDAELKTAAVRLEADAHGQKAGTEYTWEGNTWKDAGGNRLKVYDGTKLSVGPKTATPETKSDTKVEGAGEAAQLVQESPDSGYTVVKGPLDVAALSLDSETLGIKAKGRLPDRIESARVTYKLTTDTEGKKSYSAEDGTKLILEQGQAFRVFYDEAAPVAPAAAPAPVEPEATTKAPEAEAKLKDTVTEESTKASFELLAKIFHTAQPDKTVADLTGSVAGAFKGAFGDAVQVRLGGFRTENGRVTLRYATKVGDVAQTHRLDFTSERRTKNPDGLGAVLPNKESFNVIFPTLDFDLQSNGDQKAKVENKNYTYEVKTDPINGEALKELLAKMQSDPKTALFHPEVA